MEKRNITMLEEAPSTAIAKALDANRRRTMKRRVEEKNGRTLSPAEFTTFMV